MGRPLALLDVDGVLVPYGLRNGGPLIAGGPKRLPNRMPLLVAELQRVFEVHYCTQWNARVATLDELMGQEIPYVEVRWPCDAKPWQRSKQHAISTAAGDRPVCVFEDHVGDLEEWAALRAAPTKLVKVSAHLGLEHGQVAAACRWAVEHAWG